MVEKFINAKQHYREITGKWGLRTTLVAAVSYVLLVWPSLSTAGSYTFTKIADTNDAMFGRFSGAAC